MKKKKRIEDNLVSKIRAVEGAGRDKKHWVLIFAGWGEGRKEVGVVHHLLLT